MTYMCIRPSFASPLVVYTCFFVFETVNHNATTIDKSGTQGELAVLIASQPHEQKLTDYDCSQDLVRLSTSRFRSPRVPCE